MPKQPVSPLQLSPKVTYLPVVNGSGTCALAVRQWLLDHPCDCVAVGLPTSFKSSVLDAVEQLPNPSIVIQKSSGTFSTNSWHPSFDEDASSENSSDDAPTWSYVPIDPCQPTIMALRVALGEHWHIEFCDLETTSYEPLAAVMPDAYALQTVSLERFAAAMLPSIVRPYQEQVKQRLQHMAIRLHELEKRFDNILFVNSILEWPWLHEAYHETVDDVPEHDDVEEPETYAVNPNSLIFLFGELPFITGLYERARVELDDDRNLAIDGVKQLLMSARSSYKQDMAGGREK